jgi:hypothetical protein
MTEIRFGRRRRNDFINAFALMLRIRPVDGLASYLWGRVGGG